MLERIKQLQRRDKLNRGLENHRYYKLEESPKKNVKPSQLTFFILSEATDILEGVDFGDGSLFSTYYSRPHALDRLKQQRPQKKFSLGGSPRKPTGKFNRVI